MLRFFGGIQVFVVVTLAMPRVLLIRKNLANIIPGNILHSTTSPGVLSMPAGASDLMTAGNIAKSLGVPDAKVKKAIQELKIKPAAKKGVCNYYGKETVAKLKAVLK